MKTIIGLFLFLLIIILLTSFYVNGKGINLFPTAKTVTINSKIFSVEVATSPAEQEKGLSGRSTLAADHGMVFPFSPARKATFWMKAMKFPLDILFVHDGKIVTLYQNVPAPASPTASLPVYTTDNPVDEVIEFPAGTAKKYGITMGATVITSL